MSLQFSPSLLQVLHEPVVDSYYDDAQQAKGTRFGNQLYSGHALSLGCHELFFFRPWLRVFLVISQTSIMEFGNHLFSALEDELTVTHRNVALYSVLSELAELVQHLPLAS